SGEKASPGNGNGPLRVSAPEAVRNAARLVAPVEIERAVELDGDHGALVEGHLLARMAGCDGGSGGGADEGADDRPPAAAGSGGGVFQDGGAGGRGAGRWSGPSC